MDRSVAGRTPSPETLEQMKNRYPRESWRTPGRT